MFYSNSWTKCLICLIFITSGDSECPKPQVEGNQNVFLTNDALLKNDFPEGSEVTFQCANGYMKEQGSESITCTSGEWSTLELICKNKDCGAPKEMPHLTYEFDKGGTLFGASARAICDKGYQVQGSSYRQCYATGWSGRSRCEVVTCEEPIDIMNGMISEKPDKQFPEYGDVIQYSCDEGYTLIGNKSIECDEDGEYNSFRPECKDVNDIPLKPITTSTVPPTIQDFSSSHAAVVGSVIGFVIAPTRQEKTQEEKRSYYNFKMTKLNAYPRARTAPVCVLEKKCPVIVSDHSLVEQSHLIYSAFTYVTLLNESYNCTFVMKM
ncbi:complement decay-accelerating factor-like isoform X3 [Salvelinus alpinus]|uniref:complement decay-accelerating factor-like isoform X3 n=1 Tax=Salvelinus alpinus TaxID=8036 RepID=UPI0039FB9A76